jgi:hypothetical protein
MPRRLIFIVGLQKSGTTLLSRLLQETGQCEHPFKHEGDDFWGNVPAFAPTEAPAGVVYQRSGGDDGHEIRIEDATESVRSLLLDRLSRLPDSGRMAVNKNPYNSVRLPWLRRLFPAACIVGMIRHPVANVFSLVKKYVPHEGRGQPPEEGWWGVKPRGWRTMLSEDKVLQCARQWQAVNRRLLDDAACVDMLVGYHQLCETPREWVERILGVALGEPVTVTAEYPPIRCFDHEFAQGSRLQSKNRHYRSVGTLEAPDDEAMEIGPFDDRQIEMIEDICGSTAEECAALR